MNLQSHTVKFGDLLVKLQLVSEKDVSDALQVAPQFGMPLGRTLVLSGRLTEAELQLAVELQPLINKKGYPLESAKKAALLVRNDHLQPSEALTRIGIQSSVERVTLGSILVEAGAISKQQMDDAQKVSYETGMRLGRVLVLNNALSHNLLTKALGVQTMLHDKRISLTQAIELLKVEVGSEAPSTLTLEAHQMRPAPAKKQVRFGEFLVLSGLATEAEMLQAVETSLNKRLSLGEAIIDLCLISKPIFDKAIQLHEKVCAGELPLPQATEEIHRMVFGDPQARSGNSQSPVLGELLKMTGFVTDTDIREAIELSHKYPSLIGKMLVVSGAIDEATLIASLRCQYLLKHGYLGLDDAIRGLQYMKQNRISFDDALEELGVRKPTES